MTELQRTEAQWVEINRALVAGPEGLTADMYQNAVVCQVQTDTPAAWPLGPIEHTPPSRYMVKGLFEEYIETFKRDEVNPSYHRMARLVLPAGVAYPFDEPDAIRRNLKEFGDLSWYTANILASHHISLADTLPQADGYDVLISDLDVLARQDANALAWRWPGHNYVFHATSFLDAVRDMDQPLMSGNVEQFFERRDRLAATAGHLMLAVSVVAQTKFGSSLAEVLYQNILKVEERAASGTTLYASGDDRERAALSPAISLDGQQVNGSV